MIKTSQGKTQKSQITKYLEKRTHAVLRESLLCWFGLITQRVRPYVLRPYVLLIFVHGAIECRGAEGVITADTKHLCHLDVVCLHLGFLILFLHCSILFGGKEIIINYSEISG